MSDEQRKDEEAEVEAHRIKHWPANDEPQSEDDHEDEVEAHVRRHNNVRID